MSLRCCYMLLLLPLIAVVSGLDFNAVVGSEVRFKPDITAASSLKDSSITWKYAAGGEVIKVIEWDNDFQTLEMLNPKFKTRVDLDRTTAELTIRDLKLEHTGLYTIEINNKEQEKKFTLTVMESVTTPKLEKEASGHPNDVMYLACEYDAKISWTCSEGKQPDITKLEKPRRGELLTFKRAEMPGVCCTCTLSNEVSEKTSDPLCEKDLFTASSGTLDEGAIAGIVLAVFGLIASPFILYIFCNPFRKHIRNKCENNSRLKGSIGCLESCRNTIRCLGDDNNKQSNTGDDNDRQSNKESEPMNEKRKQEP